MAPSHHLLNPDSALLPRLIDRYADEKPGAIYAEYPKSATSYTDGFHQVTFRDFGNVVNGLAWWLTQTLGPGKGEVLPYIGPNNLRYPALVLACIKAGYALFCTSPRNSPGAHTSLLQRLDCTKMLATAPRPPMVSAVIENNKLYAYDVPSVQELLTTTYPRFEFIKTHADMAGETFVVLRTSGSTGIPKPISWTHDFVRKHMAMTLMEGPEGAENTLSGIMNKRLFSAMPSFHINVSQSPDVLDYCGRNLHHMLYAGGDLPQAVGDTIAPNICLINAYGASEQGLLAQMYCRTDQDPVKDWRYINFHPALGLDFRKVTDDEYEMVWVRKGESEAEAQFPVFTVFPDLQEYHTNDLWIRHPDQCKAHLWRYSSRTDDVIVFSEWGENKPWVLVAGAQRFQASLLIELAGGEPVGDSERTAAIERIWPTVQGANSQCPAHARIDKAHILFTQKDKLTLRAGKGTIQRAATLALYAKELDDLYTSASQLAVEANSEYPAGPGRVDDAQAVAGYVRQVLASVPGWKTEDLSDEDNLFHLGFDSLQAMTATRLLAHGLRFPELTMNTIYLHPSISEFTQAVISHHQGQPSSKESQKEAELQERRIYSTCSSN
ncbi:acetyl-CoA synthetase-like protein [Aspergillus aurantiobrunneus]